MQTLLVYPRTGAGCAVLGKNVNLHSPTIKSVKMVQVQAKRLKSTVNLTLCCLVCLVDKGSKLLQCFAFCCQGQAVPESNGIRVKRLLVYCSSSVGHMVLDVVASGGGT